MLNVGTNFAPEHLEEMFQDQRRDVRRLEVRFRPYVEQASYYQFLKGEYRFRSMTDSHDSHGLYHC
jgi:hypothetical protein